MRSLRYRIDELLGLSPKRLVANRIIGRGNRIRLDGADLRLVSFDVIGDGNSIDLSGCAVYNTKVHIRGNEHQIHLMPGCAFGRGNVIWMEDNGCALIAGAGCTFESVFFSITEPGTRIEIGADCMFGTDVEIRTGDSHSILDRATGRRLNPAKNVCIGNHVWVSSRAIILKGVRLADDTVVAAGAVVTRSCDTPGVILAGNPAVVIKEGITWARERVDSSEQASG